MSNNKVVTFLTDFGTEDGYAGIMKGVVLGYLRDVVFVDISHNIPRFNLTAASLVLEAAFPHFPEGSLHIFVVDPGVGSNRCHLLVQARNHTFIGPDNGVLGRIALLNNGKCFEIDAGLLGAVSQSNTFHGRDIYAVAAGRLLLEGSYESFTRPCDDPRILEIPTPVKIDSGYEGRVIYIDHFGNLVTNLREEHYSKDSRFYSDELSLPVTKCYSDLAPDTPGVLLNSWGYFEIALREASARDLLGFQKGTKVTIGR